MFGLKKIKKSVTHRTLSLGYIIPYQFNLYEKVLLEILFLTEFELGLKTYPECYNLTYVRQ